MLYDAADLLDRFGGHAQAGGLTVKLENLEALRTKLQEYARSKVREEDLLRSIDVDTKLYAHELTMETVRHINSLAPFGQGNEAPLFLIDQMVITHAEKVGKTGSGHLKLHMKNESNDLFHALFRGEGEKLSDVEKGKNARLIGTLKKDDFNGGVYIEGKKWMTE